MELEEVESIIMSLHQALDVVALTISPFTTGQWTRIPSG